MGFEINVASGLGNENVYRVLAEKKVKLLQRKVARSNANRFWSNDIEVVASKINKKGDTEYLKESSMKLLSWLKSQDYLDLGYIAEEGMSLTGRWGQGLVWRMYGGEKELRLVNGPITIPESSAGPHTISLAILSGEFSRMGATYFTIEYFTVGSVQREIRKGSVNKLKSVNGKLTGGTAIENIDELKSILGLKSKSEVSKFLKSDMGINFCPGFQLDNYPNGQSDIEMYSGEYETYLRFWIKLFRELDWNITRVIQKVDTIADDESSEEAQNGIGELSAFYRQYILNGVYALEDITEDNMPQILTASGRKSMIETYYNVVSKIEDNILKDQGANVGGFKGGSFQSSKIETKTDFMRKNEIASFKLKRNQRYLEATLEIASKLDKLTNSSKLFGLPINAKIEVVIKQIQEIDKTELLENMEKLSSLGAYDTTAILSEYLQVSEDAALTILQNHGKRTNALISLNPEIESKTKIETEPKPEPELEPEKK